MYPVTIPLLMCAGIVLGRLLKEKNVAIVVKSGLVIFLSVLMIYYGKGVFDTIKKQGSNDFQQFLTQIAKEYGDVIENAYLALPDGTDGEMVQSTWAQQDVYLAEVYGDWFCDNGGEDGFVADQSGVLFVSNNIVEKITSSEGFAGMENEMLVIAGENYTALIKR